MKAQKAISEGILVVCDDCRFDNEAEVIRQLGGKIVKIIKTGQDENAVGSHHASEKGISDWLIDYKIINNGTSLEEYHTELKKLFKVAV